ncbi:MAG TPA: hypothetical protein VJ930_12025 [Acidimicrobiia bacterium]|nr:hypothetical protein [Acidimicrobiia bacterium]
MQGSGRARRLLLVAALSMAFVVATAPAAGAAAPVKYQITVSDQFVGDTINFIVATVPPVVPADTYKVGLANNSIGPHVLIAVGGLAEGITEAQFIALIDSVNAGGPIPAGVFEAGFVFSKPGQDHQKQFDLNTPGQYGYFCPIPTPDGTPHYKLGFVGLFDVVAAP